MKFILTVIILILPYFAKPCGWFYDDDSYFFYNLFDQTNIRDESFYPFLRDDYNHFYQNNKDHSFYSGNIIAWQKLLPEWSEDEVFNLVYQVETDKLDQYWRGIRKEMPVLAKEYILYAKTCSDLISQNRTYSWDYNSMSKLSLEDIAELIRQGFDRWQNSSSEEISIRYAYQVVRLLHYSGQYQEAINFYENKILDQVPKDELYYYLTDQVAGCYYSVNNIEKAAFLFLQVFDKSIDRKLSAFKSYSFCTNKGDEGKRFIISNPDKATHIALKSLRGFSDEYAGLKEMLQVAPLNGKMELLFARALNGLERETWPKGVGLSDKLFSRTSQLVKAKAKDLSEIVTQMIQMKDLNNRTYWLLADSYLEFINGNIPLAKEKLSRVKNADFIKQKEILTHLYEVFSWESIDAEKEQYLVKYINPPLNTRGNYGYGLTLNEGGWKQLILDYVGHTYYKQKEYAKAFLTHKHIGQLDKYPSLNLIDNLTDFVKQSGKNKFEEQLLSIDGSLEASEKRLVFLNNEKGDFYLNDANPEEAILHYDQESLKKDVSVFIFSNNTKECFSCSETEIMEDSVFLANIFSFLKQGTDQYRITKKELAINLVKLDSLTSTERVWKQKLAHYLLGNYYYNISSSGYYRQVLAPQGVDYDYDFFGNNYSYRVNENNMEEFLEQNTLDQQYHKFAAIAQSHYQRAIELSTDQEFNARCTYLMAKCELNQMYVDKRADFYQYEGELAGTTDEYFDSFSKLSNKYQGTKFYQHIIKECSYFRYYSSL